MENLRIVVKKDRVLMKGSQVMTTERIGNPAEILKEFFIGFLNSRDGFELYSFLEDKIAKEMFREYFDINFEFEDKDEELEPDEGDTVKLLLNPMELGDDGGGDGSSDPDPVPDCDDISHFIGKMPIKKSVGQ